jgi:hypothetical protein
VILERYLIIGIMFSATIILLDLYLLKRRKIDASTFALWFVIGLVIGTVSVIPSFLTLLYAVLGTEALISAVSGTAFLVVLLLIFYLDYRLNELRDRLLKLTAEFSALKYNPHLKATKKENDQKE